MHRSLLGLTLAALGAFAAPSHAAEPAALIVDVLGDVSPTAEPFSEIPGGHSLSLASDAEIIVIHYAACTESHLRGGDLRVGPIGVEATGELVSETEIECPRKVAFSEDANVAASVVLRGGEERTVIGQRPVFVLLEDGVDAVEVRRDDELVQRLMVERRLARWPADAAPLPQGPHYEIAITAGGAPSKSAPASAAAGAGVTIVQP